MGSQPDLATVATSFPAASCLSSLRSLDALAESISASDSCASWLCLETLDQDNCESIGDHMAHELRPCIARGDFQSLRGSSARPTHSHDTSKLIREDLLKQANLRRVDGVRPRQTGADPTALRRCLPPSHRARMIGWMREVSGALGLHLSTFFAATSILDRFVAAAQALPPDGSLQLLALTCMSVAVKYNETSQVSPSVWLSLAVNAQGKRLYTARDLQRCEFTVLQTIDWRLHEPTTYTFLAQFLLCMSHPAAVPLEGPPADTGATADSYPDSIAHNSAYECAVAGWNASSGGVEGGAHPAGPTARQSANSMHAACIVNDGSYAPSSASAFDYGSGGHISSATIVGQNATSRAAGSSTGATYVTGDSNKGNIDAVDSAVRRQDDHMDIDEEVPHVCAAAEPPYGGFPAATATAAGGVAGPWAPQALPAGSPATRAASAGKPMEPTMMMWWWPFLSTAVALAELTLLDEVFLPFDYSTVALACVVMAEHVTFGGGNGCVVVPPPADTAATAVAGPAFVGPAVGAAFTSCPKMDTTYGAASAVAASTGMPLEELAPELSVCLDAAAWSFKSLLPPSACRRP